MPQFSARALVRPAGARRVFVALAIVGLAVSWSSSAMAQEATSAALMTSVASVELPPAAVLSPPTLIGAPVASLEATPVGPVLASGLVRYVPSASRALDAPTVERRQRGPGLGRNVALVIVGVAAMIIGSDVDDAPGSLLVVGGAGMTLYGLYYILK